MTIRFLAAQVDDEAYLLSLRLLTMEPHLLKAGIRLSEAEHLARLRYQFDCQYRVFDGEQCVGALKLEKNSDEYNVVQLQIHPDHQSKGFGSAVMKKILAEAAPLPVRLSVLKANPAWRLYQRLGFATVGEDKDEYHMRYEPNNR